MPHFDITRFGAAGDPARSDTTAIQKAIDTCHDEGGGTVIIPGGRTFVCGTIYLKDNVELHLERGACLEASPRREDYQEVATRVVLVTAVDAAHIALTGGGIIDGKGPKFMGKRLADIWKKGEWRPDPVHFFDCVGVTVRDVNIRHSAHWTLTLEGCEDAVIAGLSIVNEDLVPNDDGLDICNCRNVRVSDCHVKAGDDAISIKSMPNRRGGEVKPCENITISNCTLESQSFALNIGCEARAPMRNMSFGNIIIRNSHRGAGIHLSHGCDIENIVFSNMVIETRLYGKNWWGRAEPIYVVAIPWTPEERIGSIKRVIFSNILCRSENGVFVYGWDSNRIQALTLDTVIVEIDSWSGLEGGQMDLRPYPGENCEDNLLRDKPVDGFFIKNATDVSLQNCSVRWKGLPMPWYREALRTEEVAGLRVGNFAGQRANSCSLVAG